MTKCIAEPLSRRDLRGMARLIREIDGSLNTPYFDIVRFLEIKLPKIDSGFHLEIDTIEEMGECHGLTYPDRNEIHIREDVYNRAVAGSGRDRLTMAHELFHLLQHESRNISFARIGSGEVETFRDPEWQADAFGGELLMPYHLIRGMEAYEVCKHCGVSMKAASYQLKKI